MKWTEFPNVLAGRKTEHTHTWPELVEYVRGAGPFAGKTSCPLLSLATYGTQRAKDNCLRSAANMLAVHGIEADYDAEAVTMAEAVSALELHGIRAAVYPSPSWTAEKPRWRIIAPLATPCPPTERARMVARLNGALGGILADESFTLSQSFYFGRVNADWTVLCAFDDPTEGNCIDELPELDAIAIGKREAGPTHEGGERAPVDSTIFRERCAALGRKLRTGDGRRELLKTWIASRSARGQGLEDIKLSVRGVVYEFFDPSDPPDFADIDKMAADFTRKDYLPPVDSSALLAGGDTFSLDQFALNGKSQEMRAKMLDDVHILGRLALLGQLTAFYTERNGGKTLLTLWLLIDAIRRGTINPADVFYINSDDTYKGLVEKTEIAERHGFKMLADGHQLFKNSMLVAVLAKLVKSDQARGKIIILDTLKKFTDLMNKRDSSDFMTALRSFVQQGGSVIMLAHVNKHRDENGKLVFSGTTDVVDDADCAYLMDKVARDGRTIVTFDNFKARGDVAEKAVYSFERNPDGGQTYAQLLDTVQPVGEEELQRAREAARVAAQVGENAKIIASVLDAIGEGITKRTELIEAVHASTGESKRRVIHALDAHTGADFLAGARWQIVKGDKNAKVYQALPLFSSFSGKEGVGSEKLKN